MSSELGQRAKDSALNGIVGAFPSVIHYDRDADLSDVEDALYQLQDSGVAVEGYQTMEIDGEESQERIFHEVYSGNEAAEILNTVYKGRDEEPQMRWKITDKPNVIKSVMSGEHLRDVYDDVYGFVVNVDIGKGERQEINSEVTIPAEPFGLRFRASPSASEQEVARALGNEPGYTEIYQVSLTPEEAVEFFRNDGEGRYDISIGVAHEMSNKPGSETAIALSPLQESAGEPNWEGELRIDEEGTAEIVGLETTFHRPDDTSEYRADDPVELYLQASTATPIPEPVPVKTEVNGETSISAEEAKQILDGKQIV